MVRMEQTHKPFICGLTSQWAPATTCNMPVMTGGSDGMPSRQPLSLGATRLTCRQAWQAWSVKECQARLPSFRKRTPLTEGPGDRHKCGRKRSQLLKPPGFPLAGDSYLQLTLSGEVPGCGQRPSDLHSVLSQNTHWIHWKCTV